MSEQLKVNINKRKARSKEKRLIKVTTMMRVLMYNISSCAERKFSLAYFNFIN